MSKFRDFKKITKIVQWLKMHQNCANPYSKKQKDNQYFFKVINAANTVGPLVCGISYFLWNLQQTV